MLRIGNGRPGLIADVHAQLNVLLSETSLEGTMFRHSHTLKLIRSQLPILPLAWTVMHPIDESSPIYGMDSSATGAERRAVVFVARGARSVDHGAGL